MIILVIFGHSWPFLDNLVNTGHFWSPLVTFGHLVISGHLWSFLIISGHLLCCLVIFDHFWSYLVILSDIGHIWSLLAMSGHFSTIWSLLINLLSLVIAGHFWSSSVLSGHIWSLLVISGHPPLVIYCLVWSLLVSYHHLLLIMAISGHWNCSKRVNLVFCVKGPTSISTLLEKSKILKKNNNNNNNNNNNAKCSMTCISLRDCR